MLCVAEIQEFYEVTLLDSDKTLQEKTAETMQIASKWEKSPPISQPKQPSVTDFSSVQSQLPSEPRPAEVIQFTVTRGLYVDFCMLFGLCDNDTEWHRTLTNFGVILCRIHTGHLLAN